MGKLASVAKKIETAYTKRALRGSGKKALNKIKSSNIHTHAKVEAFRAKLGVTGRVERGTVGDTIGKIFRASDKKRAKDIIDKSVKRQVKRDATGAAVVGAVGGGAALANKRKKKK